MNRIEGLSKRRTRFFVILVVLIAVVTFLTMKEVAEVSRLSPNSSRISDQRAVGNSLTEIRRIVSLSPATTEWLYFLGYDDLLVARTEACDWPPEVKHLPSVGGFLEPHVGVIIQSRPDLVLVTSDFNPRRVAELERSGLEIFELKTRGVEDLISSVSRLSKRLSGSGSSKAAEEINEKVTRLESNWTGLQPLFDVAPRYIGFVHVASKHVFSESSFLGSIFSKIGLQNLVTTKQGFPEIATEFLMQNQPDYAIVFHPGSDFNGGLTNSLSSFGFERFWPSLSVDLLSLPEDLFLRPGPRLFDEGLVQLKNRLKETQSP